MTYEYQVEVGGVMHPQGALKSVNITQPLFDKLSVGNACCAELTMSFWPMEDPPQMARIIPYVRPVGAEEWEQLGEFFIDTRSRQQEALEVVAYDCMLKAEAFWEPEQHLQFPMTMEAAAKEIARLMGTGLDPRCAFNSRYTVDYPADRTQREVLCDIAAAHLANWIVTAKGQLLLVPLFGSMPPETHYLVTQGGEAITLGGVKILI